MSNTLSVVIPAYNESTNIVHTASVISKLLDDAKIPFELLFIDDGSSDDTWSQIQSYHWVDGRVSGIHFSRNFGKDAAIWAGLYYATGACAVVLDCDLQHPPEKMIEMYHLWEEGYEIVEAVKSDRGRESFGHRMAAHTFYAMISHSTGIDMSRASDFKLLDRKAILALLNMKEKNAFFRALSSWIGFKTTQIEFEVQERSSGESKWSTGKLIKYAVTNLSSFSTAPMKIILYLGILLFVGSLILTVNALYQKITGVALGGFTTVIIMQGFIGSILMISIGCIGYYISKIYEETQNRPRYIVSEVCGTKKSEDE